jgi:hypothetical protein
MFRVLVHLRGLGWPNRVQFRRQTRDQAVDHVQRITRDGFWTGSRPLTFIPRFNISLVELTPIESGRSSNGRGDDRH